MILGAAIASDKISIENIRSCWSEPDPLNGQNSTEWWEHSGISRSMGIQATFNPTSCAKYATLYYQGISSSYLLTYHNMW